MFLGNSPEKLFLERASTTEENSEKRQGEREPVNSLSDRIKPSKCISTNHSGSSPRRLFLLKSRKRRPIWLEIHFGISPTRPQDFRYRRRRLGFGEISTVTLLFKIRRFPPTYKAVRPLKSNNQVGISPVSKLLCRKLVFASTMGFHQSTGC